MNSGVFPVAHPPINLPEEQNNDQEVNWFGHGVTIIAITAVAIACTILLVEVAFLIHENIHDKIWQPNPVELEGKISEKFSAEFIEKVKNLSIEGIDYVRLFKRLAVTEEDETEIIVYLEQNFEMNSEQLKEILLGAHVRLDDEGKTYEEWIEKLDTKQSRFSSHPSTKTQYGVRGSLIKELLFSHTIDANGKSYTWFQLENHPVSFGHIIRHMMDYFMYMMTNQNQGPYGSSAATDRAPIILKLKPNSVDELEMQDS